MTWTEKYRPDFFEDIKGQDKAIECIKNFINNYSSSKKKAIILHGPPGTGKTSLAYVAARETDSEIFELNASDLRDKTELQEILRPVIEQKSILKEKKIILVDELDGITGTDRGGIIELLSLIELTKYPIIMTANDVWSKKLVPVRSKSEIVQLKEIDYRTIKEIMISILRKENLFINNDMLTSIALKSKGDLRAAINDLQAISKIKEPLMVKIDEREKETDIFNALRYIFKSKTTNDVLKIFDSVNMPIDEVILWVEENIPAEYQGKELAKAYDALSKADVFKGRIYKQQYWRFLVYENALLSYGISASKKPGSSRTGFTSYKKPTRILKIWMNNQRTAKKKSIAQKYAKYVHVGHKRAMNEFPIIKQILKNQNIRKELKLNQEEIDYLDKPV